MVTAKSYIKEMSQIDSDKEDLFQEQVLYYFNYNDKSEIKFRDNLPTDFCVQEIKHQVNIIDERIESESNSRELLEIMLEKRKHYIQYREKIIRKTSKVI